jgi:hypothetical protein
MKPDKPVIRSLRELEDEVLAEGQEWMRQHLQQKLQEQADRTGRVFPPQPTPSVVCARQDDAPAHRRRRR